MRNRPAVRVARIAFGVAIVSSIALTLLFSIGGQPQLEGLLWFYVFLSLGIGVALGSKAFLRFDTEVEERPPLASSDEQLAAAREAFYDGEPKDKERRSVLRMLWSSMVALGAVFVFPIRALGPAPGKDLATTPFEAGTRLVTASGNPVPAGSLAVGEVITVFPEGHTEAAEAPTLLIRVEQDALKPWPGREDWTVEGLIAYSKICTHAACAVGLYEKEAGLLLCPCHQSTFDVLDGARPEFGPATRPLPQLPIAVDDDGYIVAQSDYDEPVGPGYWDRGRA